ncbi:MAG: 30S ribosome-binding factor RbfA [Christensenellaceae bacterium]
MKEKREKRLNSEMQKLIYEILTTKIKEPEITEMFSVSSVLVSNDLEHAKVYVSVFSADSEKKRKTFEAISSSAPQVRFELGKVMRLRYIPKIEFLPDESYEYGARIDKIISGFVYGDNDDDK